MQAAGIADVIEKAVIEAVLDTRNQCASAALNRSECEQDLAYRIADVFRRASEVLSANLSSLR